jgi:hypothetical protein
VINVVVHLYVGWLLRILKAITRQFGGYSPLYLVKGGDWLDKETNESEQEDQQRIEVWVAKDRVPVLREVVHAIGKELGQKEMFLIVPEARVDRIWITESGTDLAANS